MPPEAALGGAIDGRSDIYSLGCVAYFILTGQLVFEAGSALQMIAKHLGTDPVPPSHRVSSHIPASLDRVVMACLAKRPEDRPQSAAELTRLLAAGDSAPWTETQAREWWAANGEAGPEAEAVSERLAG
jgi:eukaryotic-like serine/threonine-protein kinase